MSDKKSFVMMGDWTVLLSKLPVETAGALIKAICTYQLTGEVVTDDPVVEAQMAVITPIMDENNERHEEICRKRSESGKRGAEKKWQKAQESHDEDGKCMANASKCHSEDGKCMANGWQNMADSDSESESDNKNNITTTGVVVRSTDVQRIVEAWNALPDPISKIVTINPNSTRMKLVKKRMSEYGIEPILTAIENIKSSDFLQGGSDRGWVVTFDWFIRPNNFPKVLEGNYTDRTADAAEETDFWERTLRELNEEQRRQGGTDPPKWETA